MPSNAVAGPDVERPWRLGGDRPKSQLSEIAGPRFVPTAPHRLRAAAAKQANFVGSIGT